VGGTLTSVYPPVSYKRKILSMIVICSRASRVDVYAGAIKAASALIETNPIGANNTYNPSQPSVVQAGYPILVDWPSSGTGDTARATLVFEGEY
jgi:hypothetical protein